MKARPFLAVLLAALLTLFGLGGAGWWLVWRDSPLQLQRQLAAVPRAAQFVPRQADLALYVLSDGRTPVAYARAVAPLAKRDLAVDAVSRLRDGAFAAAGLDYEAELSGWLSAPIALALFEPTTPTAAGRDAPPGWLLALGSRDDGGARRFLQRFWQTRSLAGTDLQVSRYRGKGLISGRGALGGRQPLPLATALIDDDLVLIASGRPILEQALDVSQIAALNQAALPELQQAPQRFGPTAALMVARAPALERWLGLPFLAGGPLFEAAAAAPPARGELAATEPVGAAAALTVDAPGPTAAAAPAAEPVATPPALDRAAPAPPIASGAPPGSAPGPSPPPSAEPNREEAPGRQGDRDQPKPADPEAAGVSERGGAAPEAPAPPPQPLAPSAGAEGAPEAAAAPAAGAPEAMGRVAGEGRQTAAPEGAGADGNTNRDDNGDDNNKDGNDDLRDSEASATDRSTPNADPNTPDRPATSPSAPLPRESRPPQAEPETADTAPAEVRPAGLALPRDRPSPQAAGLPAAVRAGARPWPHWLGAAAPAFAAAPPSPWRSSRSPNPPAPATPAYPDPAGLSATVSSPVSGAVSSPVVTPNRQLVLALRPVGRDLLLQADLDLGGPLPLPRADGSGEQTLRQGLLAGLHGPIHSLAVLHNPAAWGQLLPLRPWFNQLFGGRGAGPIPALVAAADQDLLVAAEGPFGWQLGTDADHPPLRSLEAPLAATGLIAAPLEQGDRSLLVWTRLQVAPVRSGRQASDRADQLQATLAGWWTRDGQLAWWGRSLAQLRQEPSDQGRLRQLETLARPLAPVQWALDGPAARALLGDWQPWRLLTALAGGGLEGSITGFAVAAEPSSAGLALQARLELG